MGTDAIFLFLHNLFDHWLAWVGGVLTVAVFFQASIDKLLTHERISHRLLGKVLKFGAQNLKFIALVCFAISCFQAWNDEHRNTDEAINGREGKVAAWSAYNRCDKERAVKTTMADALQSLVSSQQNSLAAQRTTIDSQQGQLNGQQQSINSCVISLGKMNPLVNTRNSVLSFPAATINSASKKYIHAVIIMTNRTMTPVGRIKCEQPFDITTPQLYTELSTNIIATPKPEKISDREYEIHVSNSAATWESENPIYFRAISDSTSLGRCSFTPQLDITGDELRELKERR